MSYVHDHLVPLTLVLLVPFSVEWAVPTAFHEGEVSTSPCMVFGCSTKTPFPIWVWRMQKLTPRSD